MQAEPSPGRPGEAWKAAGIGPIGTRGLFFAKGKEGSVVFGGGRGSFALPQSSKFLHGAKVLFMLSLSGPFRKFRNTDFFHDFIQGRGRRIDGGAAGDTADAPVPLSFPAEVKADDGDCFSLDVPPDVQLREVKHGVNTVGLILEPERPEGVPGIGGPVFIAPGKPFLPKGERPFHGREAVLVSPRS